VTVSVVVTGTVTLAVTMSDSGSGIDSVAVVATVAVSVVVTGIAAVTVTMSDSGSDK